jgi:UDP-N-acetylmuramyl pentapeptide phosphotransferase/UDP-N-acetylglucosamine-1-phosphate transferase
MRHLKKQLLRETLGAVAARGAYALLTKRPPGDEKLWARTNHRGEPVTLLEGPAFVVGAVGGTLVAPGLPARTRAAALLAGAVTGALGGYDDLAGSGASRGFKGHFAALAKGEVTSGAVKLLGIGAAGLVAAAVAGTGAPTRRGAAFDVVVNGALIAGTANLLNLFDLRPGRAIKVGILAGVPLELAGSAVVAAPLGAAVALLPEDLAERAMLGDAGANALGALLGLGAALALPRSGRIAALAAVAGLNAVSEVVSFTKVIAATPPLRRLDELGRRPPVAPMESDPATTEPVPSRESGPATAGPAPAQESAADQPHP